MILVDVNLLIYSSTVCPEQEKIRDWLDGQINERVRVGLPWPTLTAYLRIVTNVRLYGNSATTLEKACLQIQDWLSLPNVWAPVPTENHLAIFKRMLGVAGTGKHVPDAHLAALAVEHGLVLCSSDGDFARYPGLRWMNPLLS